MRQAVLTRTLRVCDRPWIDTHNDSLALCYSVTMSLASPHSTVAMTAFFQHQYIYTHVARSLIVQRVGPLRTCNIVFQTDTVLLAL